MRRTKVLTQTMLFFAVVLLTVCAVLAQRPAIMFAPAERGPVQDGVVAGPGESEVVVENRLNAPARVFINGRLAGTVRNREIELFVVPDGNHNISVQSASRGGGTSREIRFSASSQRFYFRATAPTATSVNLAREGVREIGTAKGGTAVAPTARGGRQAQERAAPSTPATAQSAPAAQQKQAAANIEHATDELLKRFTSWLFEYNDDSGERFIIWTDVTRKGFEFISFGVDESVFVEEVIYSFNEWPAQAAIHIQFSIPETSPKLGISFLDENNVKKYFYIGWSGMDGSLALHEISIKERPKQAAADGGNSFTDSRDGRRYRTVKIGNLTWMAENLNHETGNSRCYDNDASNCQKYGRLYDWNTAMAACPAGWRLPTRAEWDDLFLAAGGANADAAAALKTKTGWNNRPGEPDANGTDGLGFSAMPGGLFNPVFTYIGDFGFWWSATTVGQEAYGTVIASITSEPGRKFDVMEIEKDIGVSVRCVR